MIRCLELMQPVRLGANTLAVAHYVADIERRRFPAQRAVAASRLAMAGACVHACLAA
jgi:hypothetical protein